MDNKIPCKTWKSECSVLTKSQTQLKFVKNNLYVIELTNPHVLVIRGY